MKTNSEQNKYSNPGRWLILTEGARTEPSYMENLISRINEATAPENPITADIRGMGRNTVSLVASVDAFYDYIDEEYGRVQTPYENIAILFDKDCFSEGQFNKAVEMAHKLDKRLPLTNVYPVWSNESFELWLNLHFSYIDSDLDRDALNDRLTEIFRKKGLLTRKETYATHGKSHEHLYDEIIECGGSLTNAVKFSRELSGKYHGSNYAGQAPCTMMHLLVDKLLDEAGVDIENV